MGDEIVAGKSIEVTCPVCNSEISSDGKTIYKKGKGWRELQDKVEKLEAEVKGLQEKPKEDKTKAITGKETADKGRKRESALPIDWE